MTANVVLQPGAVIRAQVQQILGSDQVQISIGGQSIVVGSQVPLQAGQTLQLSVSQAPDGSIELAVVNPGRGTAGQSGGRRPGQRRPDRRPRRAVTRRDRQSRRANPPDTGAVAAPNQLTPPEALAVTVAAQAAATQQTSLAPLFADLGVAAGVNGLPPQVQRAVAQVLAQRTSLDPSLTGDDIKQAFQSSGLFLEASLASGSAAPSAAPDLKAALIVLRQVLTTSLGDAAPTPGAGNATATGRRHSRDRSCRARIRQRPFRSHRCPSRSWPSLTRRRHLAGAGAAARARVRRAGAFAARHGVAAVAGRIRLRRGERRHVVASDNRRRGCAHRCSAMPRSTCCRKPSRRVP